MLMRLCKQGHVSQDDAKEMLLKSIETTIFARPVSVCYFFLLLLKMNVPLSKLYDETRLRSGVSIVKAITKQNYK